MVRGKEVKLFTVPFKLGQHKEAKINFFTVLIVLVIAIFSLYFVFAEHVITTSSGGTSLSLNEGVSNLYNISVNNTDAATASNITEVNITLPSAFTYINGTQGSNCSNLLDFANTTTILSWDNSTSVVNGTDVNYFWFNATVELPATYDIIITTTNTTGSFSTNISVTINDTTSPTATFGTNPITTLNDSDGNITFDLKCTDGVGAEAIQLWSNFSGTWAVNQTNATPVNNTWWNITVATIADGKYIWGVYCNDSIGNTDRTNTNRTVIVDSTNPTATLACTPEEVVGGGTGGLIGMTYSLNDVQFSEGYTNQISVGDKFRFTPEDGEYHYAELTGLSTTSATIQVTSTPQTASFAIGEIKKFEVTGDDYYDVALTLNDVVLVNGSASKADITIQANSDEVVVEEPEGGGETGGSAPITGGAVTGDLGEGGGSSLWLFIIIGIIIVIVVVFFIFKKGSRRKRFGY
jgi:hypothetical protein